MTETTAEDSGSEPLVSTTPTLRLGFARGVAPSKWADRWKKVQPGIALELVPLNLAFGGPKRPASCDVVIERSAPGSRPVGGRHSLRLYTEAIALVVPIDHELAKAETVSVADLALVPLLDHPDHSSEWPAAEPWQDPAWMPRNTLAALELVAAGTGAMLLPQPLARHISDKRKHAILRVTGEPALLGSTIWATWDVDRDDLDVQQLIGVMRGRTARSSRPAANVGQDPEPVSKPRAPQPKATKKPKLNPNSRGAQLAAAREKIERAKAEKRKAARRKRR
ncbi:LysR family transcriptional regulator substrate-binding protein [Leucobacter coleopterorum]|uniref:LysR family transcriptional regulator substrate-binding protein n=1 Tax=Leucobacter coleopterorum TaxID=2714933 RepID=A0ABX6JY93_9MICO|nr:LysR family transcriptional regulator substrate-binding protein [Leucobacter coleopterorum]QIM19188.1 LysR family transcriptional regulator substrate-binding protein [Leucobacter coleopterorum]